MQAAVSTAGELSGEVADFEHLTKREIAGASGSWFSSIRPIRGGMVSEALVSSSWTCDSRGSI